MQLAIVVTRHHAQKSNRYEQFMDRPRIAADWSPYTDDLRTARALV